MVEGDVRVNSRGLLSILQHIAPPELDKRLGWTTGRLQLSLDGSRRWYRHLDREGLRSSKLRWYGASVLLRDVVLCGKVGRSGILWFVCLGMACHGLLLFLKEVLVEVIDSRAT